MYALKYRTYQLSRVAFKYDDHEVNQSSIRTTNGIQQYYIDEF